ncbi:MAG: hypothetical protein WD512_11675 [Candidatus Paceibacterota bacterium]
MSIQNEGKYNSFEKSFKKYFNSLEIDQVRAIVFFSVIDKLRFEIVYSLRITAKRLSAEIFEFTACWQEEELNSSLHNVCYNNDESSGLYSITTNTIIRDLYLEDKYNDGSDGYFSDRISTLFLRLPKVANIEATSG